MTRKGDPTSLQRATRGMKPAVKPNEAQQEFNRRLPGAKANGLRQARQLAQCRSFVYDGSLAPTCLSCGEVREDRRLSKCHRCAA